MHGRFLVGLDLGGGGARCLVADAESGRTASASRAVGARPGAGGPMTAEFAPEEVWSRLAEAVREALARAQASPDAVAGIAATSMRHGCALLDAQGRELLVTSNRDARGLGAMLELAAASGPELHRRTGHWPNPVQLTGRLRWIAREAPELARRAASVLALSDWLAFRLCGELASEATQAGESGLLEVERAEWALDLMERLDLPARWFPPLHRPGSPLGALSRASAEALGLRPGTPVAVGGADTQCALLGAGVLEPGALAAVAGTSAPVLQVQGAPLLDPSARLWTVHHLRPGLHALESNAGGMGEALEWIAGLLFPDQAHPVLHLLAEAGGSPPGATGILSSLGAEVMDARRISLPIGHLTASWLMTAGDPARRGHLARAVLEGMACALRANAEQIEAVSGRLAPALRLAGGMSRSALFAEIAGDVLGRPVEVASCCEASALGAAICAGAGAGVFRDLGEGSAASRAWRARASRTPIGRRSTPISTRASRRFGSRAWTPMPGPPDWRSAGWREPRRPGPRRRAPPPSARGSSRPPTSTPRASTRCVASATSRTRATGRPCGSSPGRAWRRRCAACTRSSPRWTSSTRGRSSTRPTCASSSPAGATR